MDLLYYLREHALGAIVNLAYVSLTLWYAEHRFKEGLKIGEQLAHLEHTIRENERREASRHAAEVVAARHARKKGDQ